MTNNDDRGLNHCYIHTRITDCTPVLRSKPNFFVPIGIAATSLLRCITNKTTQLYSFLTNERICLSVRYGTPSSSSAAAATRSTEAQKHRSIEAQNTKGCPENDGNEAGNNRLTKAAATTINRYALSLAGPRSYSLQGSASGCSRLGA